MTIPVPLSVSALTLFGIVYGWLLHRAAVQGVYHITRVRFLDAYVLSWVIGLLSGYTPMFLYLAFGFNEMDKNPVGERYTERLHWVGRAEVISFVLYAVIILTTVKQRTDQTFSLQDLQWVIVSNVAFAFIAILFTGLASLFRRRK